MAVVVITGTSSGIGLVTALAFARQGDAVYATMRNLKRSAELREAAAREGLAVNILQLDVTDNDSIQRAIDEVLRQAGRIDVLVNNAGFEGAFRPVEDIDDALMQQTFDTNVFGPLRTIRAVLPGMRKQGNGCIVNVSSLAGRAVAPAMGPYTLSKWALEALSEQLAIELRAHNLRVAIIEPGFFATPILTDIIATARHDDASPYADAERRVYTMFAQSQPVAGDPRQVAEVIVEAVRTHEPKLRYLVGADAEALWAGRTRMTDEEYIELGRPMSDEDYWQEFMARFPMPAPA